MFPLLFETLNWGGGGGGMAKGLESPMNVEGVKEVRLTKREVMGKEDEIDEEGKKEGAEVGAEVAGADSNTHFIYWRYWY